MKRSLVLLVLCAASLTGCASEPAKTIGGGTAAGNSTDAPGATGAPGSTSNDKEGTTKTGATSAISEGPSASVKPPVEVPDWYQKGMESALATHSFPTAKLTPQMLWPVDEVVAKGKTLAAEDFQRRAAHHVTCMWGYELIGKTGNVEVAEFVLSEVRLAEKQKPQGEELFADKFEELAKTGDDTGLENMLADKACSATKAAVGK